MNDIFPVFTYTDFAFVVLAAPASQARARAESALTAAAFAPRLVAPRLLVRPAGARGAEACGGAGRRRSGASGASWLARCCGCARASSCSGAARWRTCSSCRSASAPAWRRRWSSTPTSSLSWCAPFAQRDTTLAFSSPPWRKSRAPSRLRGRSCTRALRARRRPRRCSASWRRRRRGSSRWRAARRSRRSSTPRSPRWCVPPAHV